MSQTRFKRGSSSKMPSVVGYAKFLDNPRWINAPKIFWENYAMHHISQIIRQIIDTSNSLKCLCCGEEYTLNYTTKATLFLHYKSHRQETIQYYLDNLLNNSSNTHSVNDNIVGEAIHN